MTDSFTGLLEQAVDHLSDGRRMDALLPLLPCILVMVLSLTACGPHDKETAAPPRPVKYITVHPAALDQPEQMTGDIHAHDETALSFRLDGRMLTRHADVGVQVHAGDVLATQDSTITTNALRSAQADVDSARAAERVAALNLKRLQQLMPSGAIARAQLDSARSEWESATARLKSSQASLNSARENLSWSQLRSPFDGVVIGVNASAGQVVSAGQTVMTLAYGSRLDVVLDVPFPAVLAATSVFQVSLIASPSVTATAHLRDISPQADPQTRTWRVRLTLDNPPAEMLLGASVSVALPQATPHALPVPASALTRIGDKPAVFVVDTVHGRVQRKAVVISRFSASEVYIASGLIPGEKVVTAGVSTLRDGEAVSTREEQE